MKAELVCVLVVCSVIVQGRSLQQSQLKRHLFSNALLRDRMLGGLNVDRFKPNNAGRQAGLIQRIQDLLSKLAESLEPFKEDAEDRNGNQPDQEDLKQEIDNLALEIQRIESKLNSYPAEELQTSVMDLLFRMYAKFGETFFNSVWDIYNNLPREEPMIAEEYPTTGNDMTQPTHADRLSRLADQVKTIGNLVDDLANGDWETYNMVQAIAAALDEVTPESCGVSTTPATAEGTVTYEKTTTSTTTQPTQAQTDEQATTENTPPPPPSTTTTTTTEDIVEKQLRRRLTNLLLKKLLQNEAP